MTKIPVIDLFAGAGGLSYGAHLAGADVRLSVELDQSACHTLRLNKAFHPGDVLPADVSQLTGQGLRKQIGLAKSDPLIIVGGPPCQPFSKASYWTDPGTDSKYRRARANGIELAKPKPILNAKPDPRRSLIQEFLRIVEEARADAFLFENVPSILHPRNKETFQRFISSASDLGYLLTVVRANAVAYGVPQKRHRVIVLGFKGNRITEPPATHAVTAEQANGLKIPVTCKQAIQKFTARKYFEPQEVVKGRWAKHLEEVAPGMNYKALTAWAGHPNPSFVAETRFWHFLLKLDPNAPSWTIAANPGPWIGPFHWDSRRLRTPELAALQGFPDGYQFSGDRRARVRQIGNALPPPLARAMVTPLLAAVSIAGT